VEPLLFALLPPLLLLALQLLSDCAICSMQ
jgi:hypothetical protein